MSASQAIRELIASLPTGEIFTPSLFAEMGSRAAVDQALMRLAKAGSIDRIGHGLYVLPQKDRFGVKPLPTPEQVAWAIARAEGATIEVHGAEAARRFGFTTQMPAQPVFYTTGSSRTIRLEKMVVRLQHVAPRKLILEGRPAGQALSALWYLGRNQVTSDTFMRLAERLPATEFRVLCGAKSSMPAWMVQALHSYEYSGLMHG